VGQAPSSPVSHFRRESVIQFLAGSLTTFGVVGVVVIVVCRLGYRLGHRYPKSESEDTNNPGSRFIP
jgi:hypothetical protein